VRSTLAGVRTLVIPFGALPGSPQIAVGVDVPAELAAYYAAAPFSTTLVAVILYRKNATDYTYDALTAGGAHVNGTVKNLVPGELSVYAQPSVGFSSLIYGLSVPSSVGIGIAGVPGSSLDVAAGSAFTLFGNGTVGSGGKLLFQSGSTLQIDQGGAFVIDATSQPRGLLGVNSTDNGTVITTPAGGAERAVPSASWDAEPTYQFLDGRMYKVTITGFVIESTGAAANVCLLRVRKGAASTAGTVLLLQEVFNPPNYGGLTKGFCFSGLFKNSSGATVNSALSLTINGVVGAGTWSLVGTTAGLLTVEVFDVGATADFPNLAGTLVSV
jgi:hypothetical protein